MMNAPKCATHRETDALGPCSRCGDFVCAQCVSPGGAALICTKCAALTGLDQRAPTPWERRAEIGLLAAWWMTWKEVMFNPDPFFRRLKPDGETKDALLYAWVTSLIIIVPNFLLQAYNYDQFHQSLKILFKGDAPSWLEHVSRWEWAAMLTLPPIVLFPVGFYLGAAVTHLGCLVWSANKNGFGATARTMGYSQSATVAAVIPVVGGLLVLYVLALNVIGIARTQDVTIARATGATLTIPLLLSCCAVGGIVVAVVAAFSSTH
jgi:hypothetical protein